MWFSWASVNLGALGEKRSKCGKTHTVPASQRPSGSQGPQSQAMATAQVCRAAEPVPTIRLCSHVRSDNMTAWMLCLGHSRGSTLWKHVKGPRTGPRGPARVGAAVQTASFSKQVRLRKARLGGSSGDSRQTRGSPLSALMQSLQEPELTPQAEVTPEDRGRPISSSPWGRASTGGEHTPGPAAHSQPIHRGKHGVFPKTRSRPVEHM